MGALKDESTREQPRAAESNREQPRAPQIAGDAQPRPTENKTRPLFPSLPSSFPTLLTSLPLPPPQVLKDAKKSKAEIEEVVLVGGSTRIPKARLLPRQKKASHTHT